jgi:hypothetical protein
MVLNFLVKFTYLISFSIQSYQNEIMRYDMQSDIRYKSYLIMRHDTCHIFQNFQLQTDDQCTDQLSMIGTPKILV